MDSASRNVRAILFDLDGTLIDSYALYLEAYRRALTPVLGFAPTDQQMSERRPSAERHFLVDWLGDEVGNRCHAEMCDHYRSLHREMIGGLYDGVREMLGGLRSAGIPLGIVTGKGRSAWQTTSAEIDLGEWAVVVTEDDAGAPKPDPAGLLMALDEMDAPADEVVYIGDSASDMEAGRAAGMLLGAVLWPKSEPGEASRFLEEIDGFDVDWRFERPADVVRTFAPWC